VSAHLRLLIAVKALLLMFWTAVVSVMARQSYQSARLLLVPALVAWQTGNEANMSKAIFFFLVAFLSLLLCGYFFLWTISSASLRFIECQDGYSLFSTEDHCRLPALLELLTFATFSVGVLFFIAGLRVPPGKGNS
jgi:hypothetical protein